MRIDRHPVRLVIVASACVLMASCAEPDAGAFENFKKAIESVNEVNNGSEIMLLMDLRNPAMKEKMQQYAEAECSKGKKTACSIAYCGSGTYDDELFFSRKCVDVLGRAHGNGWVESSRKRDKLQDVIVVRCEKTQKSFARVECHINTKQCIHNNVENGSAVRGLSAEFASVDAAAQDACSDKNAPSK